MILEIQEFFRNTTIITNTLIFSSFLIFVLLIFLSFFRRFQLPSGELIKKWGGCLIVFILALYSNNGFVYALAIFIIATIFTKLEFLENLAAIFWRQDAFWKYRIKQTQSATDEEVESKVKREIDENISDEIGEETSKVLESTKVSEPEKSLEYLNIDNIKISTKVTPARLKEMIAYEKTIISKLRKEKNLFEHFYIFDNRTIIVDRLAYTLDAMASPYDIPSKWVYVIEIKYSTKMAIPQRWFQQIQSGMFALQKYLDIGKGPILVRGILIIPSNIDKRDFFSDQIAILRYDTEKDEFVNKQKLFEWINEIN